jgi:hypothetical protein
MAGGNGPVIVNVRFPGGMKTMVELYQKNRELPSFSRAVIELLETHPEVLRMVQELLTQA